MLLFTWDKRFKKIVLKSDSSDVVGHINKDRVNMDRNYILIIQIKSMLDNDWEVKTLHVYKKTNCIADWLTNYKLVRDLLDRESDVLVESPLEIYTLLYYDLIRSIVPRLI